MTDESKTADALGDDELEKINGEPLPDREQMSVIREPMPMTPLDPVFTTQPIPADEA